MIRARLTFANVCAGLTLFVVLGGSSYAAVLVSGKNIKDGTITGRDIKDHSLTASEFASPRASASAYGEAKVGLPLTPNGSVIVASATITTAVAGPLVLTGVLSWKAATASRLLCNPRVDTTTLQGGTAGQVPADGFSTISLVQRVVVPAGTHIVRLACAATQPAEVHGGGVTVIATG